MILNEKKEKTMSEAEKKALEEKEETLTDEALDKVDGGCTPRLLEREYKRHLAQTQKK